MTSPSKTARSKTRMQFRPTVSRGYRPYPAGGWFRMCGHCGCNREMVTNGKDIVCKECGHG